MSLQILINPSEELYTSFVIANNGSFLQSFGWGQWQETNGRTPVRFLVQDEQNKTILAAQFLTHHLPAGKTYLYCPYGPVVNCKLQDTECKVAIETLLEHMQATFSDAVFIRLEPTQPLSLQPTTYHLQPTLHIQPGSTITLNLQQDAESLLAGMHPKTRYNIKVAERKGVEIQPLETTEAQAEAAALFVDTLVRRKLVSPPASYYKKLLATKTLTTSGLGAYYNGQLVACGLFVDFGHVRTYLFGGSSTEHKNVMAPYLLHWTAIQNAQTNKLTTYDFFGAEGAVSDGSGFARFKQGFGGTTIPYAGAWDIVLNPIWYTGYKLLRTLNRWAKHK